MDEKPRKREQETLFGKHRENIYFRWGLTAFVVIALCIVLAQFVSKLPAVFGWARQLLRTLAPVVYGLGIAYLLDPVVWRVQRVLEPRLQKRMKRSERATGLARGIGIVAALVLLVLIVWALLAMILPQLIDSILTIIGNLPGYYDTLQGWVNRLTSNLEVANFTGEAMETVYDYLSDYLTSTLLPKAQSAVVTLTSSAVGMARALLNLIIGLIISIYLLIDKEAFLARAKKLSYAILGERRGNYFLNVCTFANHAFGGFIGGKLIDSLIIGVLCFLGLSLMRMPYTLLIAIIVGFTNIIPFFGPYLGAIPSALLLLVIDPMKALTFVIFILVLQQLDGNVIGPKILGEATGVSGFWVVVSILVFGSLFGIVGMVVAVPLFAVIYKVVTELINHILSRRGLKTESEAYRGWSYPPRPDREEWLPERKLGKRKAAEEETGEREERIEKSEEGIEERRENRE